MSAKLFYTIVTDIALSLCYMHTCVVLLYMHNSVVCSYCTGRAAQQKTICNILKDVVYTPGSSMVCVLLKLYNSVSTKCKSVRLIEKILKSGS